jgi:phosphate transport system permease protein
LIVCFIGIPGGIFLAEYAGKGRVVRAIRSLVLSLAGTPSVVYGLFGFAVFVLLITKKSSLIAGWLTLSTMIIPVVVLNTETALKAVPQSQIEAALALGMSKWGAIWKVALPQALPGIMTGLVLASGRAAGEAPPILLTAGIFYTTQQPRGLSIITEPVMNLPYHISEAVKQSGTFKEQTVWGTCLVLMAIILLVNALALYVRSSQRRKNRA